MGYDAPLRSGAGPGIADAMGEAIGDAAPALSLSGEATHPEWAASSACISFATGEWPLPMPPSGKRHILIWAI